MNNNKGFFNRKWALRLVSLILAIFLFTYVNGSKDGFLRQNTRNSDNQNSALMSNKSATIKMPLDITVDNSKYVVSGYPQYVKVRISGPSALVTTTNNTQNFKVYADLSKLGTGEHRVRLKTSGLNSELSSTVVPKYITVNIQPRRTVNMKVTVRLSTRNVGSDYQVGRPRADINSVQVTGSQSEINQVNKVVAFVDVPRDAKNDLQRQVTLQALDKKGQTLNVVIWPSTTNVTVPITKKATATNSSTDNSGSGSTSSSTSTTSSVDATPSEGSSSSSKSSRKEEQVRNSSSNVSSSSSETDSSQSISSVSSSQS